MYLLNINYYQLIIDNSIIYNPLTKPETKIGPNCTEAP